MHSAVVQIFLVILSLLSLSSQDYQTPFVLTSSHPTVKAADKPLKIAIVGAGPGGSSASYYLTKFFNATLLSSFLASANYDKKDLNVESLIPSVEIDVYEKSERIGGRCWSTNLTVKENGFEQNVTVEFGASIFVDANKNLVEAAKEFRLDLVSDISDSINVTDHRLGIWNPETKEFNYVSSSNRWVDLVKGFWRYGLSAFWTSRLTKTAVDKFLKIYSTPTGYTSIDSMVMTSDMSAYVNISAFAFFESEKHIRQTWIKEIIETITRVNYGQNLDQVHPFAALVGFCEGDVWHIRGGNQKIFEEFLKRSISNIRLKTQVTSVEEVDGGKFKVATTNGESKEYDVVILATGEIHKSDIKFNFPLSFPPTPYHHLHVTYVVANINSTTFPIAHTSPPPNIFTMNTLPSSADPLFNSISQVAYFPDLKKSLFKVFSSQKLSFVDLNILFFNVSAPSRQNIWTYEWDAYPKMTPVNPNSPPAFPPLQLSKTNPNIFYLNSMEPFISTMETETLVAKNVVKVLWERFVIRKLESEMENGSAESGLVDEEILRLFKNWMGET
ncbi:Prenylcysteine lyase-domain-containing protein [Paraphysoderma sedebokerense]|nr:Prenylcysteine lyase-domain-containing protein [Paraphysoderma sedebokerense]